jgi:hypothetical protein
MMTAPDADAEGAGATGSVPTVTVGAVEGSAGAGEGKLTVELPITTWLVPTETGVELIVVTSPGVKVELPMMTLPGVLGSADMT